MATITAIHNADFSNRWDVVTAYLIQFAIFAAIWWAVIENSAVVSSLSKILSPKAWGQNGPNLFFPKGFLCFAPRFAAHDPDIAQLVIREAAQRVAAFAALAHNRHT